VLVADVFVLLTYAWFILVVRENNHASSVIEAEPGQRVVRTGPYAIVRHPMYLGSLVFYLLAPVALGSWWAVMTVLPLAAVLVARIRNEERLLAKELGGYREYTQVTQYRLIPCVW
jgi:protein-S-isoprenylcysteine O-methyltransferase Ste14